MQKKSNSQHRQIKIYFIYPKQLVRFDTEPKTFRTNTSSHILQGKTDARHDTKRNILFITDFTLSLYGSSEALNAHLTSFIRKTLSYLNARVLISYKTAKGTQVDKLYVSQFTTEVVTSVEHYIRSL